MTGDFALSEKSLDHINSLKKRLVGGRSLIIPALLLIREEFGYIPPQALNYLAELLGVEKIYIKEVISWYTMFNEVRTGKYNIQVCRNISCCLMGAESVLLYLVAKLSIIPGETSKDGLFTLSTVECLGSCGTAPVMLVNDRYYENLTYSKIDEILEKLADGKNNS